MVASRATPKSWLIWDRTIRRRIPQRLKSTEKLKWLLDGAKPTRAARNILSNAGVFAAWDAAKRGETVAIEAKELKADEPKKKPEPVAESADSDEPEN
jgi:hypothetical protein